MTTGATVTPPPLLGRHRTGCWPFATQRWTLPTPSRRPAATRSIWATTCTTAVESDEVDREVFGFAVAGDRRLWRGSGCGRLAGPGCAGSTGERGRAVADHRWCAVACHCGHRGLVGNRWRDGRRRAVAAGRGLVRARA